MLYAAPCLKIPLSISVHFLCSQQGNIFRGEFLRFCHTISIALTKTQKKATIEQIKQHNRGIKRKLKASGEKKKRRKSNVKPGRPIFSWKGGKTNSRSTKGERQVETQWQGEVTSTGNSPAAWSWFERKTKLMISLDAQILITEDLRLIKSITNSASKVIMKDALEDSSKASIELLITPGSCADPAVTAKQNHKN